MEVRSVPTFEWWDKRVLVEERSTTVKGVRVDVYVYAEEYSKLLGSDYKARHVRAEVVTDESMGVHVLTEGGVRKRLIHDRQYSEGRSPLFFGTPLPEKEEQVQKVLDKAESYIEENRELVRELS